MPNICFKPSKTCKTVGELKALLNEFSDDMLLRSTDVKTSEQVVVRFEQEKDNAKNQWISIGGGYW